MSDHNRQSHQSSSNAATDSQFPSRKQQDHYEKVNQDSFAERMAKIRENEKKRVPAQRYEKVDWYQKIETDKHFYYHIEGKGVSRFNPNPSNESEEEKESKHIAVAMNAISRSHYVRETPNPPRISTTSSSRHSSERSRLYIDPRRHVKGNQEDSLFYE